MRYIDGFGLATRSGANARKSIGQPLDDGDHRRADVRLVLVAVRVEPLAAVVPLERAAETTASPAEKRGAVATSSAPARRPAAPASAPSAPAPARVRCGTMPIMRSISISWARWCISCSFAASSISKRVRDGGSAPGRNVIDFGEERVVAAPRASRRTSRRSPSAARRSRPCVRGFASSAPTFCMYSAKSIFSIGIRSPCSIVGNVVPTAMCASVCPMVRESGDGLKSYLLFGNVLARSESCSCAPCGTPPRVPCRRSRSSVVCLRQNQLIGSSDRLM